MSHEETQRICANCGHPKRGHELPRAEGGYGGGDSGACVTYGCSCRHFEPTDEYKEQEYSGDVMPAWVAEDMKMKTKSTPHLREYGLRVVGGAHHDSKAWPKDIGTIRRHDGIGWWNWVVEFDRGRSIGLGERELEDLLRVRR